MERDFCRRNFELRNRKQSFCGRIFFPGISKDFGGFCRGPDKGSFSDETRKNFSSTATLDRSLEYEVHMQEIAVQTDDSLKGINAFIEKRSVVIKDK